MAGTPESARAWLMVAAAFMVGFVVFGTMYSFGSFLAPMAADLHASRAATSALFSITGLAFYMAGPVTGRLGDRCGPAIMVGAGAVAMGAGLVATAFIGRLWLGYLTYGIGVGVGAACAYVPTLAIIGGWFIRRRGTALGIAAAGTGCGTFIVPPLAAALIERCGWRITDAILGAAFAALLAACAAVVRPPPVSGAVTRRTLRSVVRSHEFALLYASWTFATTALFVPLVYLPAFAMSHGAGQVAAAALLSCIGGTSLLGRVGIGFLGDRIGMTRLFKGSVLLMAASYVLWIMSPAYGWLVLFATVLGVGYGVRIALMPAVLIEFFGLRDLGAILGLFFTASGVAAVLGPVLAGAIVDRSGGYEWGMAFALGAGALGFLVLLPLRLDPARKDA